VTLLSGAGRIGEMPWRSREFFANSRTKRT
jgi:hypothetical protein